MNNKELSKFDTFSRALIATKDVDPVYDLIKSILNVFPRFEPEWFCFVYTTFYSLESAIKYCEFVPTTGHFQAYVLEDLRERKIITKFGHERRGSQRNVNNQNLMLHQFCKFIRLNNTKKELRKLNQQEFRNLISKTISFHGPWATYKVSEVFEKALNYNNLAIMDLGIEGKDPNSNDGPIGGLRWIFGRDETYDKSWYPIWNKFGEELAKEWGVDIGEVESSLCKWHKFKTGKYWIGHDIMEFIELEHVVGTPKYKIMMYQNFHKNLWYGYQKFPKENKKVFVDKGVIINAQFADKFPSANISDIISKL